MKKRNKDGSIDENYQIFSYVGPKAIGGLANAGSNSIEKIADVAFHDAIDQLNKWGLGDKGRILIKLLGHSRGAVAMSFVANRINKNLKDIIVDRKIDLELVVFDPVPGYDMELRNIWDDTKNKVWCWVSFNYNNNCDKNKKDTYDKYKDY